MISIHQKNLETIYSLITNAINSVIDKYVLVVVIDLDGVDYNDEIDLYTIYSRSTVQKIALSHFGKNPVEAVKKVAILIEQVQQYTKNVENSIKELNDEILSKFAQLPVVEAQVIEEVDLYSLIEKELGSYLDKMLFLVYEYLETNTVYFNNWYVFEEVKDEYATDLLVTISDIPKYVIKLVDKIKQDYGSWIELKVDLPSFEPKNYYLFSEALRKVIESAKFLRVLFEYDADQFNAIVSFLREIRYRIFRIGRIIQKLINLKIIADKLVIPVEKISIGFWGVFVATIVNEYHLAELKDKKLSKSKYDSDVSVISFEQALQKYLDISDIDVIPESLNDSVNYLVAMLCWLSRLIQLDENYKKVRTYMNKYFKPKAITDIYNSLANKVGEDKRLYSVLPIHKIENMVDFGKKFLNSLKFNRLYLESRIDEISQKVKTSYENIPLLATAYVKNDIDRAVDKFTTHPVNNKITDKYDFLVKFANIIASRALEVYADMYYSYSLILSYVYWYPFVDDISQYPLFDNYNMVVKLIEQLQKYKNIIDVQTKTNSEMATLAFSNFVNTFNLPPVPTVFLTNINDVKTKELKRILRIVFDVYEYAYRKYGVAVFEKILNQKISEQLLDDIYKDIFTNGNYLENAYYEFVRRLQW